MTTSISPRSKHFRFMEALAEGETVGTRIGDLIRFDVTQIPDLKRKAVDVGMPVFTELFYCEERKTTCAKYSLPLIFREKWKRYLRMEIEFKKAS